MAVADRTHDILRAACRVIAERGCDGMRMGDVARAAGVSSALVHYYFDTRSELLRRAFLYADEQVDAFVHGAVAGCDTPRERLETAVLSYLVDDAAVEQSWRIWSEMLRAALYEPSLRPDVEQSYRSWVEEVAGHVRDSAQASVDDEAIALRLCALVDGLAQQALLGGIGRARARALVRHAIESELQP
jgi:AcrR family transcriptional regulator